MTAPATQLHMLPHSSTWPRMKRTFSPAPSHLKTARASHLSYGTQTYLLKPNAQNRRTHIHNRFIQGKHAISHSKASPSARSSWNVYS